MNMLSTIEPKSDQINADDLIGRTMTITIREVKFNGGTEQPVGMYFDGSDKAYRPCKSMCRVLVAMWGPDAKNYVGRSLTLYRDPEVRFGPLAVGGIRISHMSHIDAPATMALTASKANRKPFTVKPLVAQNNALAAIDPAIPATLDALKISARAGTAKLETDWKSLTPEARKALRTELDGLKRIAADADAAEPDDFATSPATGAPLAAAGPSTGTEDVAASDHFTPEGPDDSQRGDGDADSMEAEAAAWIDRYEALCRAEPNGEKLAAIHREADENAGVIRREYPDLYERRLAGVRPADAPERETAHAV